MFSSIEGLKKEKKGRGVSRTFFFVLFCYKYFFNREIKYFNYLKKKKKFFFVKLIMINLFFFSFPLSLILFLLNS